LQKQVDVCNHQFITLLPFSIDEMVLIYGPDSPMKETCRGEISQILSNLKIRSLSIRRENFVGKRGIFHGEELIGVVSIEGEFSARGNFLQINFP